VRLGGARWDKAGLLCDVRDGCVTLGQGNWGMTRGYELVDYSRIPGTPCPCGTARRGFADVDDFPATVHVTEIAEEARLHYHKRLTETYFFLECGPDAAMQLDEERLPVKPGMAIMIRPGTRHRALGRMRVVIFVLPKFDPADEWFDDAPPPSSG
jgi:mannose-6-phosphate isomerase-like protein (cupin superfamily)